MEDHTTLITAAQQILSQSGLSSYAIARRAGVDLSHLRGFQRFGRGLSLQSLDRVLSVVGDIRLAEAEPTEQPIDQPTEPVEQPPEQLSSAPNHGDDFYPSSIDDAFLNTL